MAKYRIFSRRWWADRECTIPEVGRKHGFNIVDSVEEARRICADENSARPGFYRKWRDADGNLVREFVPNRGPHGMATEFEEV